MELLETSVKSSKSSEMKILGSTSKLCDTAAVSALPHSILLFLLQEHEHEPLAPVNLILLVTLLEIAELEFSL